MKEFKKGDRVCSNVSGFYLGQPGTITGKGQIQYNMDTRYNIELDLGKNITLAASKIKKLEDRL